jgi:hypothetical protein
MKRRTIDALRVIAEMILVALIIGGVILFASLDNIR